MSTEKSMMYEFSRLADLKHPQAYGNTSKCPAFSQSLRTQDGPLVGLLPSQSDTLDAYPNHLYGQDGFSGKYSCRIQHGGISACCLSARLQTEFGSFHVRFFALKANMASSAPVRSQAPSQEDLVIYKRLYWPRFWSTWWFDTWGYQIHMGIVVESRLSMTWAAPRESGNALGSGKGYLILEASGESDGSQGLLASYIALWKSSHSIWATSSMFIFLENAWNSRSPRIESSCAQGSFVMNWNFRILKVLRWNPVVPSDRPTRWLFTWPFSCAFRGINNKQGSLPIATVSCLKAVTGFFDISILLQFRNVAYTGWSENSKRFAEKYSM